MTEVRCPSCKKLVGKVNGTYSIQCPRCKTKVEGKT